MNYILNDTIEVCRIKYLRSLEFRCAYNNNFTNMENNEEVFITITLGYMEYRSQFYGLSKQIKNAKTNCFRFSETVKLTTKSDSNLSNINICYELKLPKPVMQRSFFKKISQNLDYAKSHCNARNNLFHFACRRWILCEQSL